MAADFITIGPQLGTSDFARVRARAHALAGLVLSETRRSLIESRLRPLVERGGFASFARYLDDLEARRRPADEQLFINALTNNLTRFFREDHHLRHLSRHVADLVRGGTNGPRRRIRIWSAGCSSGQEPYSIALALLEAAPALAGLDFRILATDIDTAALDRAVRGIYPAGEDEGLPADRVHLLARGPADRLVVPETAREVVTFRRLNLIEPWPMRGPFEAIFCRNVAIYFDPPTQARLFGRLSAMLAPEGFLYLGHAEKLDAGVASMRPVGRTIYRKAGAVEERAA